MRSFTLTLPQSPSSHFFYHHTVVVQRRSARLRLARRTRHQLTLKASRPPSITHRRTHLETPYFVALGSLEPYFSYIQLAALLLWRAVFTSRTCTVYGPVASRAAFSAHTFNLSSAIAVLVFFCQQAFSAVICALPITIGHLRLECNSAFICTNHVHSLFIQEDVESSRDPPLHGTDNSEVVASSKGPY